MYRRVKWKWRRVTFWALSLLGESRERRRRRERERKRESKEGRRRRRRRKGGIAGREPEEDIEK